MQRQAYFHPRLARITGAQRLDIALDLLGTTVDETPLRRDGFAGEVAAQIGRTQQANAQPGVERGLDDLLGQQRPPRVRLPLWVMVQIVKLADRAHACQRQLDKGKVADRVNLLRRQLPRQPVHLLAPRPEGAAPLLGAPAQRPLEGVGMDGGEGRRERDWWVGDGDWIMGTLVSSFRALYQLSRQPRTPSLITVATRFAPNS